jgi:hypothetical protein
MPISAHGGGGGSAVSPGPKLSGVALLSAWETFPRCRN